MDGCAACRAEVADMNAVWRGLEAVKNELDPAPDPGAKLRFQGMLAAYQAGMAAAAKPTPAPRVLWFPLRPAWQAAAAAGLLIAGILCGRLLPSSSATGNGEMAQLRGEVQSLHQMVALSMMQQQSPSARLRGVTYSERIVQPDRQVLSALLEAVNHDTNINVRLSAVDALQKFAIGPEVPRAMVDAIPGQESPLVQIALIDMLVQLDARAIAPDLERIAAQPGLDEMVQQRARWALRKLETIP